MNLKQCILSSSGIKNIIEEEKEFTFIFGHQKIRMNNHFAEFISPKISNLHLSDPTIDSLIIDYDSLLKLNSNIQTQLPKIEEIISDEIITLIQDLSSGTKVELNEEQSIKIRLFSIFVGNEELFQKMNELFPIEATNTKIDHYLENLQLFECLSRLTNEKEFNLSNIIETISKNFYSIDKSRLKQLPKSTLYSIISNDHLKIESEDSLFEFIQDIFNNNIKSKEINDFYELIIISNLSEVKFKEFISSINIGEMTGNLWQNIINRFLSTQISNELIEKRYSELKILHFLYEGKKSHKFQGIIHHLTNECGGNVSEKGVVEVKGSSILNENYIPQYAADLDDTQTCFHSKNENNSWLRFDFKEKKVRPTHYSIRSYPFDEGSDHLTGWVIEGSNDGESWNILDSRSYVKCLDEKSATKTFEIQKQLNKNEFYRFLRLKQNELNAASRNYLSISALEFFGSLF